ncbi:DUF6233 domain-containing protein [Streptomyces sp. NPDC001135]
MRFARRVVEQQTARQLDQIDQWIADEERREHERQQGEQHRPPAPDWLLEVGLNRETAAVYVHADGCWNAGGRSKGVERSTAVRARPRASRPARTADRTPSWASSARGCPVGRLLNWLCAG